LCSCGVWPLTLFISQTPAAFKALNALTMSMRAYGYRDARNRTFYPTPHRISRTPRTAIATFHLTGTMRKSQAIDRKFPPSKSSRTQPALSSDRLLKLTNGIPRGSLAIPG
jgi:hypothetical protein